MNQGIRFIKANVAAVVLGALALVGLYIISRADYLLFHTLVELFSVIISFTIFVLIWNSRAFLDNGYLMYLGMAFLFVGALDLLHALAYRGMTVFPGTLSGEPNAANLATQLWLAGRYLQSLTMVAAPIYLIQWKRNKNRFWLNPWFVLTVYAVVTVVLILSIALGLFPAAFKDGVGLTPFKIGSEYLIILFFAIGLLLIQGSRSVRDSFDEDVRSLLALSIAFNIGAEVAFTEYLTVVDIINLAGHLSKIVAVYLIYKAIIETGMLRPYNLLFRELAQRETALRNSQAREQARAAQMEAIMDVVPAIVWIAHDPGSRNVTGNNASADLLGLPPNANHSRYDPEIERRFKFYDGQGNLYQQETLPLHVAAATGQPVRNIQETIVTEDGTEYHLFGSVAPLLDSAGQPAGAVGAFIDITGRVHAEQALLESERRYRTLFESMAEGFALLELIYNEQGQAVDYRFLEVNPAMEKLIGLSREDLIGKTRSAVTPEDRPNDLATWVKHFAQVVESGQSSRVEDFSQLAGRYLETLINPIQGSTFAILSIDVTERRLSQESLRLSEARMRRLVNSNIIGIIYSRGQGRVTLANDALLELLGYTRSEYEAGKIDWTRITPPEYQAADEQALAEARERGACTPYQKEFVCKDGSRVPVLIGFTYFPEDELAPFVSFMVDLTSQKQAEAAVLQYAARLEQSNRELQDFAFVASHDLQEPLRKIQAFGERISARLGDGLDEDTRDYLNRMLSAAARMRAMINDLLALSRVTTQGKPFERVDLNEIAREVLSDLETRIERSHGQVQVEDLPTLNADPLQMHQLLQNLIGNALKFHKPDEPPKVKLYGECTKDNQKVIIYIQDNGIGFEEQYTDRIFQPFQRLHGMSQYEGSGMGLAICRKIVERHSGNITARSAPGQGTTFVITLPVRPPAPTN